MSNNAMSTTDNRDDASNSEEDLSARLDVVEGKLDFYDEHVLDRLDAVEDAVDRIDALEAEVESLRSELKDLHMLDESAASTPKKRAETLRHAMLKQYRAREDSVSKYYREVIDTLEEHGHGEVYPAQAYAAIEDAAETPGFVETEVVKNGDQVQGIKLVPDELPPSLTVDDAVNEINNGKAGSGAGQPSDSTRT